MKGVVCSLNSGFQYIWPCIGRLLKKKPCKFHSKELEEVERLILLEF